MEASDLKALVVTDTQAGTEGSHAGQGEGGDGDEGGDDGGDGRSLHDVQTD